MKTFKHRSMSSMQEVFHTIGAAVRDEIIANLKKANCLGFLCDDVCNVSTIEQMVTFVQYVNNGKMQVKFLAIDNLLESSSSANAETMRNVLQQRFNTLGIDIRRVSSLASDGASVMMGKTRALPQN